MWQRLAALIGLGGAHSAETAAAADGETSQTRTAGGSEPVPQVFLMRVPAPSAAESSPRPVRKRSRWARLQTMPLAKAGLFGRSWSTRFTHLEIHTVGQFLDIPAARWRALGMTASEVRKLQRWQDAIRLAASMPGMKPYEALLLFAVHRRRRARLANESPGHLHRDLVRYGMSTRGQRLLRQRSLPDRAKIARWIEAARTTVTLPAADD